MKSRRIIGGASVVALALAGLSLPAVAADEEYELTYEAINQSTIKAVYVSSEATYENPGTIDSTLDGNNETFWHSDWKAGAPAPHELIYDLGKNTTNVGRISLTPRQDNLSGHARVINVYTSSDPKCSAKNTTLNAKWDKRLEEKGISYNEDRTTIHVDFEQTTAHCVRISFLKSWTSSGNEIDHRGMEFTDSSLAEFNVSIVTGKQPKTKEEARPPVEKVIPNNIFKAGIDVTSVDRKTWKTPSDTPAWPYLDKDGSFHYVHAAALYKKNDPRHWQFYKGQNMDHMFYDGELNNSGTNANTTVICNNSVTGKESTYSPNHNDPNASHSEKNYCDLINVWVDPDTGDWYGLVHNEFTPSPFGDGYHYDGIDYAVSKDQGKSWTIEDHVITSPYSTERNDTTEFPHQTYHYGDGDPRLYVDYASGYFYVFYGSRILNKPPYAAWVAFHEHVARAPISEKMAKGSWQKWYNGQWSEPGIKGKESNILPVTEENPNGYTPIGKEYNPKTQGYVQNQFQTDQIPKTSPLFVMDISYNAYLGLYIGQPQNPDQSGNASQEFYATDNLATQKWIKIGDTGEKYKSASWYRWFLDTANKTNSAIVGKDFRGYCSFGCAKPLYSGNRLINRAEWNTSLLNLTVDAENPYKPVESDISYTITNGQGNTLKDQTTNTEAWTFKYLDDGSYMILNKDGKALGVDSSSDAGRAWTTKPTLLDVKKEDVGQQWFIVPTTDKTSGERNGKFRLINRYSGHALGFNDATIIITPQRSWDGDAKLSGLGAEKEQIITLTAAGEKPKTGNEDLKKIEKLEADKAELEKKLDQATKDKEVALTKKKEAEDAAQKAKESLTKINDELAKLQKEYEKAIDGKEALKTKIDTLNKQRQTLENQINTAKSELAKLTKENEKIQSELDKAKTELEKLKKQLEEGKKAPKENPQPGPKPVDPTPVPPGEDPSPQVKDVPQDKVDTKITADTKAESKGLAKTGLSLGIITVLAALCIIGGTTAIRRRNN